MPPSGGAAIARCPGMERTKKPGTEFGAGFVFCRVTAWKPQFASITDLIQGTKLDTRA